jgi:hypothetical protein
LIHFSKRGGPLIPNTLVMNAVWIGDALVSSWKYLLSADIDGRSRCDGQEVALRDYRGTVDMRLPLMWSESGHRGQG